MPNRLFTLFTDPFNLGVADVFKMAVIICVQFMFSYLDALLLMSICMQITTWCLTDPVTLL